MRGAWRWREDPQRVRLMEEVIARRLVGLDTQLARLRAATDDNQA